MGEIGDNAPKGDFDPLHLRAEEKRVVDDVRHGRPSHFTDREATPKAVIRADFIRHLMLQLPVGEGGPWAMAPGGVRIKAPLPGESEGIRITGAQIDGALDLSDGRSTSGGAMPVLALEYCDFSKPIKLEHARLQRLSLRGSRLRQVHARGIKLEGPCNLSEVSPFASETMSEMNTADFVGAQIDGDFYITDSKFIAAGTEGAPGIKAFWMNSATINGNFEASNSHFSNPGHAAISIWHAVIHGSCYLDGEFRAEGSVSLARSTMASFSASGGQFINDNLGALTLQGATIYDSCLLNAGFRAQGEVSLFGVHVGGSLSASRGAFSNAGKVALNAENISIGGDVFLNQDCEVEGRVSLWGAKVTQSLDIGVKEGSTATWLLTDATVNRLIDREGNGWGKNSRIIADGFRYDFFDVKNLSDAWPARRKWLKLLEWNKDLGPQPYEQIARVLASMGHGDAARSALVHQIKREMGSKRLPANPLTWPGWLVITIPPLFLQWLFGAGFRFGYSPGRALITVALLVVLGTWGTYYARDHGLLIVATQPMADVVLQNNHQFATSLATGRAEERTSCKGTVAPLLYAIDALVPIVDLGEEKKCEPGQVDPPDHEPKVFGRELDVDGVLRGIKAFYALLGAVATSLMILTFSGVLRKKLD